MFFHAEAIYFVLSTKFACMSLYFIFVYAYVVKEKEEKKRGKIAFCLTFDTRQDLSPLLMKRSNEGLRSSLLKPLQLSPIIILHSIEIFRKIGKVLKLNLAKESCLKTMQRSMLRH